VPGRDQGPEPDRDDGGWYRTFCDRAAGASRHLPVEVDGPQGRELPEQLLLLSLELGLSGASLRSNARMRLRILQRCDTWTSRGEEWSFLRP